MCSNSLSSGLLIGSQLQVKSLRNGCIACMASASGHVMQRHAIKGSLKAGKDAKN
jgi:hypothetical protein